MNIPFLNSTSLHETKNKKHGFSLMELIVVISITSLLASMAFVASSKILNFNSIAGQAESVRSHIERARIYTLASKNNASFGVYFSTTTARVFQGTTYVSASSTDQILNLTPTESIVNIVLSNGAQSIYFNKISGQPNATGTITISAVGNSDDRKIITIYATGIIDIQ